MSHEKPSFRRRGTVAAAALTSFGLVLSPTVAQAAESADSTWEAAVSSVDTGVNNGYQLAEAGGTIYVADAQWRSESKLVGTVESTPFTDWEGVEPGRNGQLSQSSMRTTFSPYGIGVDPDVNGEAVVVTTTARQNDPAYGYGGGVVIYSASQGGPTDADRVYDFEDGSPILAGPRRVAIDAENNRAYVTNLGAARSSQGPGFVLVLDLTKRGEDAVIARIGLPDEADETAEGWWTETVTETTAGVVGVAVDETNNLIYVGTMKGDGSLYVIDGSQIDGSKDAKNTQAYVGAVTKLDANVGVNARPTYDAVNQKIYVSAYNAGTITVVDGDPASATYGEVERVLSVPGTNATEVDPVNGVLYSANLASGVTAYDISEDFEQIVFTGEDGTESNALTFPAGESIVNFAYDEATGEMWASTLSSTGKAYAIDLGFEAAGPAEDQTVNTALEGRSVTLSTEWVEGEALTVTGTGWTAINADTREADATAGARVGVKIEGGDVAPKDPEFEDADEELWAFFDANPDGTFSVEVPFPTTANALFSADQADWSAGSTHAITVLAGRFQNSNGNTTGGTAVLPEVTVVSADDEADGDWIAEVTAVETAVQNGYQLAGADGRVYVADAKWASATKDPESGEVVQTPGTGKVVQIDTATKTVVQNDDFTQLRRNDDVVQALGTTVAEPTGKIVQIDGASKTVTEVDDFTQLSRNDGSGTEADPFTWTQADTDDTKSSMRTTFSPYGVAVDPDVAGKTIVVTTTARQTNAEYGWGGGVVIYDAAQDGPTDADRVFEYEDGTPVFSGPRRVAVDDERNLAYVTNLGTSRGRGAEREGYITVLDLTKRGADAVVAQVTVPNADGAVGVAVDEENNRIYVGAMAGDQGVYVIDGDAIDTSDPTDFALNDDAITALAGTAAANARPTYDADTQKIYVSSYSAGEIAVFDADPESETYGTKEAVITVAGTNANAVDAEKGLLYSANLGAGVTVYDIEDEYAPITVTNADGSTTETLTFGAGESIVTLAIDEATGTVWGSTLASTGKAYAIDITEQAAAAITAQPQSTTADAGTTAVFEVEVSGAPAPTIQWQQLAGVGGSWTDIAGETGATLEVAAERAGNGTQYRAVVTNEHGSATSDAATLSVRYAPVITASPLNQTATAGGSATFTAAADANPAATVEWQYRPAGASEWTLVAGETGTTLTIDEVAVSDRGTQFRAVFSNELSADGTGTATEPATLAVDAAKPAPLDEATWRALVPVNSEALLTLDAGKLTGTQTGTTVTISNIPVPTGDWVEIFGYSDPVYLGSHYVSNGATTVDVSGFAAGTHHLAVYNQDRQLLGYVGFEIAADGSGATTPNGTGAKVLSTTGGDSVLPFALGGGALLLLGGAALALGARRRKVATA